MSPEATIAIVSWNTTTLLDECLTSLQGDADAGLIDVWVHDNGSTDGSPAMVAERHPWAKLVEAGENLGFGPAVNRVAAQSRSEWIAPANADIRVPHGTIAKLIDAGRRDPGAAIIAPRLVLPDGSTQESIGAFQTMSRAVAAFSQLGRISSRIRVRVDPYLDQESARRVEWAAGAFLLVRRSAFDAVGGFDESQWMYAEDLDLCWRLRRQGWVTRYEPSAAVFHEHSAAADRAFGADGVRERQHDATWSWSVRRLGSARTGVVAALELVEGGLRWAIALVLRKSPANARQQVRFGVTGMRRARGGLPWAT